MIYDLIKNTNVIIIYKGTDNAGTVTLMQTLNGLPVNLTGATARGQIRTVAGDLVSVMTCTIPAPLTGVINYTIPAAEAAKLTPYTNIQHVWGVEVTIGGVTLPERHGGCMVEPEVVI